MMCSIPFAFAAHAGAGFVFHFAFALAFALVVELLAAADGQFDLNQAIFQIQLGGDQGEALFAGCALHLVDLLRDAAAASAGGPARDS